MAVNQPAVLGEVPGLSEELRDVVLVQPVALDVVVQTGGVDLVFNEVVVTRQERHLVVGLVRAGADKGRVADALDAGLLGGLDDVLGLVATAVTDEPRGDEGHSLRAFEHLLERVDVVVGGRHDRDTLGLPLRLLLRRDAVDLVAREHDLVVVVLDLSDVVGREAAQVAVGAGEHVLDHSWRRRIRGAGDELAVGDAKCKVIGCEDELLSIAVSGDCHDLRVGTRTWLDRQRTVAAVHPPRGSVSLRGLVNHPCCKKFTAIQPG
ncbi:hypothetical protein ON010_g3808 [Phytophthora cinnamomi]|nr:hypothetical protein ON010_g3808 [Phytophthora cinnamomi]